MTRRTRKHHKHQQRGGSRRYIALPEVTDPASMLANVDIQFVVSHGEHDLSRYLIVPENTFIYYVGKSGDTVAITDLLQYLHKQTPERMFSHYFSADEPKSLGPYPDAHVYVPGDILPMSQHVFFDDPISFEMNYTWPKGLYEYPFSNEFKSYLLPGSGWQSMFHLEPLAEVARKYPDIPPMYPSEEEEILETDSEGAITKTRAELLDELLAKPTIPERIAYLRLLADQIGVGDVDTYADPTYWFDNQGRYFSSEQPMILINNRRSYGIAGNLMRGVYREAPDRLPLDELMAAVPRTKAYRLIVVNSCRVPYGPMSLTEQKELAQRFSSASKEEPMVCVSSERRNPVFNAGALMAAFQEAAPLYKTQLAPEIRGPRFLEAMWRLQHRLFRRRADGSYRFQTRVPVEALYDAIHVAVNLRPDDYQITRIENPDARVALQNIAEALRAMVIPVMTRIDRSFAGQNRRMHSQTKLLKYTTGRKTRYTKRSKSDATGDRA